MIERSERFRLERVYDDCSEAPDGSARWHMPRDKGP